MEMFGYVLLLMSVGISIHGVVEGFLNENKLFGDQARDNGWTTSIERGERISFDLDANQLQIRTNSTVGSEDVIYMVIKNRYGKDAGGLKIKFSDPPAYKISSCTWDYWTYFTLPEIRHTTQTWTIAKGNSTVSISCNKAEIVEYHFSESNNSRCLTNWAKEATRIKFVSGDTATQAYRVKPDDYSDWQLIGALLLNEMETDDPVLLNAGLVVVGFRNNQTGEERIGTVCDDGMDAHTADIGCQLIGYDYSVGYDNHASVDYQFYPDLQDEEVANTTAILIDEFSCPNTTHSYRGCHYHLFEHDCNHSEDLVLACAYEQYTTSPPRETPSPTTTPTSTQTTHRYRTTYVTPTWPIYTSSSGTPSLIDVSTSTPMPIPSSSPPLDDEAAGKIGRSGMRMKVGRQRARAKISDIWDEVFG